MQTAMQFYPPEREYIPASQSLPSTEHEHVREVFEFVERTYCPSAKVRNRLVIQGVVTGWLPMGPLDGSDPYVKIAIQVDPGLWKMLFGLPLNQIYDEEKKNFFPHFNALQKLRYFPWAINGGPMLVVKIKEEENWKQLEQKFEETGGPVTKPQSVMVSVKPITYKMAMGHKSGEEAFGMGLVAAAEVILTN